MPALMLAGAAALWWACAEPPTVDAGDLAAALGTHRGREVVVTGEWVTAGPCDGGHMVVVLRGRFGGRVACHFEDVPDTDRARLEARLLGPASVAIRGRYGGTEDGMAVLRGCRPFD